MIRSLHPDRGAPGSCQSGGPEQRPTGPEQWYRPACTVAWRAPLLMVPPPVNGTDTGQDPAPAAFYVNGTVCAND